MLQYFPNLIACRVTFNRTTTTKPYLGNDGKWCNVDIKIPLSRTGPKMASVSLRVVQFHRRPRNWCWHSRIAMLRPCTTLGITSAKFLQNRSCFGTRPGIELHSTGRDVTEEYWWPSANDLHRDDTHLKNTPILNIFSWIQVRSWTLGHFKNTNILSVDLFPC